MLHESKHAVKQVSKPAVASDDAGPSVADVRCPPVPGLAVAKAETESELMRSLMGEEDVLGGTRIPGDVLSVLRRRQAAGTPLPAEVAERAGAQLGADLSGVRVHADGEAHQIARSVQSVAFTYGDDIYFTKGTYRPDDSAGRHLLAHELAHVAQRPSPATQGTIGRADDAAEHCADRAAIGVVSALQRQATHQTKVAPSPVGATAPLVLQRTPIDFKRLGAFLAMSTAKRETILEQQSPSHLQRLVELLEERRNGADADERAAIDEVLDFAPTVLLAAQKQDIDRIGRGSNWANASLLSDNKVIASQEATVSGLKKGTKATRWGTAGKGRARGEVDISHNDSEATVFALLTKKIDVEKLQSAANTIELVFASTNGACEGCKGRINEFIRQEVLPHAVPGVAVRMRYRYMAPPAPKNRGRPTFYGWAGDVQMPDGWYEHQTTYR